MPNDYQYIELSFINDYNEIKRQIVNTIAITFLLDKGYEATNLNSYLESTQYGYNASAKAEGKHRLLRTTDINGGAVNWNNVPYCDCDDEEKYFLNKGDILIARTGGTTGKSFLINKVTSNALFASYLIKLRANKSCLPEFMSIFLNSYVFWSQISELKSGSAQPNVKAEKLKTLSIPDCPISIQRKVVDIINDVDVEGDLFSLELKEKIESVLSVFNKNQELKKELDQQQTYLQLLRQTILQEAVQGRLTQQNPTDEPATGLLKRIKAEKEKLIKAGKLRKEKELPPITEDEIPFELPEGWLWCRLGEVATLLQGSSFNSNDFNSKEGIKSIKITNVGVGEFINNVEYLPFGFEKKFNQFLIIENDILISLTRPFIKQGLKVCLCPEEYNNSLLNQRVGCIKTHPFIYKEYLYTFMQSPIVLNEFKYKYGDVSQQSNLKSGDVTDLLIPLPPLAEQQRIVAKVQQLQQQLSQLEAQVQQSRQYAEQLLQSVLKEAFEQKAKVYEMKEEVSLVAEE